MAKAGETSPITIVSLAMQLFVNDVHNRDIASKWKDDFDNVARGA